MTNEKLMKKAQELIGKWIYDKDNPTEYLYAYDCYESHRNDNDVVLECIALRDGDGVYQPYIKETEIWMSEFKEYYHMVRGNKGIKAWEKIKKHYDKMFKRE